MTDETWRNSAQKPAPNEIAFDYIKATDFRVVWADGAIGGATPSGQLQFCLYSERKAIPLRQIFAVEIKDGYLSKLGQEVSEKQTTRGSIVRELACDVHMSVAGAENLANWLLQRVEEMKKLNDWNAK